MIEVNQIYNLNCIEGLKLLDDNSIQCCVTSPPYFGLRDYGTARWEGGLNDCDHQPEKECNSSTLEGGKSTQQNAKFYKNECGKCGAIRTDEQIGLEETPEKYAETLVEVFTEVKRVLKKDGTLWLNLGDSYSGSMSTKDSVVNQNSISAGSGHHIGGKSKPTGIIKGLKPKDLIGIPWMVAFALRKSGWYLRQDIIWHKPNPMPESVTDRCTKSHEYIFLLSKSNKYYYNHAAVFEAANYDGIKDTIMKGSEKYANGYFPTDVNTQSIAVVGHERWKHRTENGDHARNKRSVWTVTTKPFSEAHFATFPEDLIVDCIKAGSKDGDLILDPFMGAGTTALVARKLNRNFIGFEINQEYIKIAEKRLRDELGMFY